MGVAKEMTRWSGEKQKKKFGAWSQIEIPMLILTKSPRSADK